MIVKYLGINKAMIALICFSALLYFSDIFMADFSHYQHPWVESEADWKTLGMTLYNKNNNNHEKRKIPGHC